MTDSATDFTGRPRRPSRLFEGLAGFLLIGAGAQFVFALRTFFANVGAKPGDVGAYTAFAVDQLTTLCLLAGAGVCGILHLCRASRRPA